MEHEIPFGNSTRENGTTFLDFPLFLGIFQWDEPTKRVPFTAEPEIPEILSKWKVPLETSWKFLKILASPKIFYCILIMEAGRVERLRQSHLFACLFVVLDQLQCPYFK